MSEITIQIVTRLNGMDLCVVSQEGDGYRLCNARGAVIVNLGDADGVRKLAALLTAVVSASPSG